MKVTNVKRLRQNGGIHLIASDKNHIFHYEGVCKIFINYSCSLLFVEPFNEEFKPISAMFKWKFFAQKNILFVLAENDFQDFILIFDTEFRCNKVYDLIYRKRAKDIITNEMIYQRVLSPILLKITKVSNNTISELLLKWMNKLEKNDQEFYVQMMKNDKIYDFTFPNAESVIENDDDKDNGVENRVQRKRRFSGINSSCNSEAVNLPSEKFTRGKTRPLNKFIRSNFDFKMVNIQGKITWLKRLLIFPSTDDRQYCYEYHRNQNQQNIFHCSGCKKLKVIIGAKLDQNENLLVQENEHVCEKILFIAEKYFDLQIIKKPNYEILENCSTKSGRILIIFDPKDRTQCHEFQWRNSSKNHRKQFHCQSCDAKAKIINFLTDNEYIQLSKMNHECQFVQYNPEKYFKFQNFILAPNFEIRTGIKNGKERKTLIVFAQNDSTKFYIYLFHSGEKFRCKNCYTKKIFVNAKLQQNDDGENYVVLSKLPHVCKPEKYIPQKENDNVILHPPDFKVMEETKNATSSVFVFESKDKELGYVFSRRTRNQFCNRYECRGCESVSKKNVEKSNGMVQIYLCKDENGEYFVQMKNNQKHLCQPKKYEPQKYEIKELETTETYFYYRNKRCPKSFNVAIFHPTNSSLCYPFLYAKSSDRFHCLNCKKCEKFFSIHPPKMDENGKEYFIHDSAKHVCKPSKISSLRTLKFQKLERNEIIFNENARKKEVKINETRIVKLPNFEFRPNRTGKPEGKLVIFDANDKSLCYEYFCNSAIKSFVCSSCRKKRCVVTAKVHFDEERNEKFIELSKKEHICEAIKDDFNDRIIPASVFMVLDREDKTKTTKIIVFTTEEKESYYELRYSASQKSYKCIPCSERRKNVFVKLHKKENGEEYLFKMKNDHVCTPKKFDQKILEPPAIITVSQSCFELHKNQKGEENKRLIVFTSEKKEFFYVFSWQITIFRCNECSRQNKSVTARVKEDGSEKYLEMSNVEHVCTPKYNDRQTLEKIPESMFELHKNKNGEANKRLIVFTSEKKDFVYEYYWRKPFFCCFKCMKQMKNVNAKLLGENEKYLEISKAEHVCAPIKFDPKDLEPLKTVPKAMFELYRNNRGEENKKVIIFTSEKKDFVYEYYCKSKNLFHCNECRKQSKHVSAKLHGEENEKYLEISKEEHVCAPIKYEPKHFEPPKNLSETMFELYKNTKGDANKKLVIFTSDKKDFVYEYYLKSKNFFHCNKCRKEKKPVYAKLFGDNDEKYVELSNVKHVCKPVKYNRKNYKK